jgi:hypothetical protein
LVKSYKPSKLVGLEKMQGELFGFNRIMLELMSRLMMKTLQEQQPILGLTSASSTNLLIPLI